MPEAAGSLSCGEQRLCRGVPACALPAGLVLALRWYHGKMQVAGDDTRVWAS